MVKSQIPLFKEAFVAQVKLDNTEYQITKHWIIRILLLFFHIIIGYSVCKLKWFQLEM
jgi:hypothetical protein